VSCLESGLHELVALRSIALKRRMARSAVINRIDTHGVVAAHTASVRTFRVHGRLEGDAAATVRGTTICMALGAPGFGFLVMAGLTRDIRRLMEIMVKEHLASTAIIFSELWFFGRH